MTETSRTLSGEAVETVVQALFVHPLKGARPVAVPIMRLDKLGALGDRRWMLVDENDVAITPRDVARLAQLVATLPTRGDGAILADSPLTLNMTGLPPLVVSHVSHDAPHRTVRCWDDTLEMADAGDAAAQWCSSAIGMVCRLMHMSTRSHRSLAARFAGSVPHAERGVTVTDGAPLLVLGAASVDALNARLRASGETVVGSDRFRANIVLNTQAPHIEDEWSDLMIGNVATALGSPCSRCVVPNIDPATLTQSTEPLRTLATYRRADDGKVMFGMNATHATPGVIRIGDRVTTVDVTATTES